MTITIGPELEEQVRAKAQAEGLTIQTYVERLIREDEAWGKYVEAPLDETDTEFQGIRAAVMEGLEEAERGEGSPALGVFADLRAKHGISD
jgi:hypothetical protein